MTNQSIPEGVDAKTVGYSLLGVAMAIEVACKAHHWLLSEAEREIAGTLVQYLRAKAAELAGTASDGPAG